MSAIETPESSNVLGRLGLDLVGCGSVRVVPVQGCRLVALRPIEVFGVHDSSQRC